MPSYLSYLKHIQDGRRIVDWRKTDNGVPFPIFEGMSIEESCKYAFEHPDEVHKIVVKIKRAQRHNERRSKKWHNKANREKEDVFRYLSKENTSVLFRNKADELNEVLMGTDA